MSAFFDDLINFLSRIKLFRTFAKRIKKFSNQQNLLEAPEPDEEIIDEPVEKPTIDSIIILPGKVEAPKTEPEEIINTKPSTEVEIVEEIEVEEIVPVVPEPELIIVPEKPIKKRVRKARAPKIAPAKPAKKPARAAKKTVKKPAKRVSKKAPPPREAQGFGF